MAHPRSRRGRRVVSLLLVGGGTMAGTSACYSYRPLSTEAVPVGTRVVASLTDRGAVEMADTVGGAATRLSGRVQAATDQRLVLALNRVTFRQGRAVSWAGEPVGVPRQYVASLSERRFSWWRSLVTTAVVSTALVTVANRLGMNVGFFGGPQPDGGGHGGGAGQ